MTDRFEKEQNTMIDESNLRREYLVKKLRIRDKEIPDDRLLEEVMQQKELVSKKYSMLNDIIPKRDF
jgi:hypothetical protein